MIAVSYLVTAQRRLAELSPRSRRRAAMVDAAVVRAALPGDEWRWECGGRTVTDAAVFIVHGPRGQVGVLKVATTDSGTADLAREYEVLTRLAADEQLGGWRTLLPVPLDGGDAGPGAFLLTTRLPGRDARELQPAAASRLTSAVTDAIIPLHRRYRSLQVPDEELLDRWVDQPADRIRAALPEGAIVVRSLAGALRAALAERPLTLGWAHGDLHRGNLLVGPDGQVTGIVDWGGANERDLPSIDLAFWLLTEGPPDQGRAFGQRVAARLASGRFWTPAECRVLSDATDGSLPDGRTLLLLAWLRHVGSNLAKSERYANSPLWLHWNVGPVLRQAAP